MSSQIAGIVDKYLMRCWCEVWCAINSLGTIILLPRVFVFILHFCDNLSLRLLLIRIFAHDLPKPTQCVSERCLTLNETICRVLKFVEEFRTKRKYDRSVEYQG